MAADKSADAIFKVLSILAPVFSSLTVQDGGEYALRTKTSFLWLEKLTGGTSSGESWLSRFINVGAFTVIKTGDWDQLFLLIPRSLRGQSSFS